MMLDEMVTTHYVNPAIEGMPPDTRFFSWSEDGDFIVRMLTQPSVYTLKKMPLRAFLDEPSVINRVHRFVWTLCLWHYAAYYANCFEGWRF